jgi:hypothetical protein
VVNHHQVSTNQFRGSIFEFHHDDLSTATTFQGPAFKAPLAQVSSARALVSVSEESNVLLRRHGVAAPSTQLRPVTSTVPTA